MVDVSHQICRILDKDDINIDHLNQIGKKSYLKTPKNKKNLLPNLIYYQGQIIENQNLNNNNFNEINKNFMFNNEPKTMFNPNKNNFNNNDFNRVNNINYNNNDNRVNIYSDNNNNNNDKNPFNLQGNNINSNNNIKLNPNNSNEVNNLNNENLIHNNFENNNNININERPQEINNIIQGMSYIPQPISSIPRNNVSEDISDLPKIINNIPEGNQGNNENINPFDNFPIQNQDINNNQNSYDENEFFLCFIVNQNNQIFLNVGPMTPFKQILVDLKKKYEYLNRMDVKSFRFNNLLIPMDSNSIENGLEKGDKIELIF
jgi:hypothetical protein